MIIGIDAGHTLTNNVDYGASGIREESNLTREVGSRVIKMFKSKGHEVVDCTVDICTGSLNDSLSKRYNKANENNCDYFISIHFNAYNGSANGTEILYCSNTDDKMERILNKFVSLGLSNRGLKQRSELAVLKHTNMSAMLIECAFCDSEEDMKIYNADIFAEAIVEGFLGEEVDGVISYQSEVNTTSSSDFISGSIGIITASKLNVRDNPSVDSNIIGTLNNGEKVRIDREYGNWYSIFYGNNGGYVNKDYVSLVDENSIDGVIATVTGINSYLNVRDSIGGNIIGKLYNGDTIKLYKKEENFYSVYYGEHGGYVSADYVTI